MVKFVIPIHLFLIDYLIILSGFLSTEDKEAPGNYGLLDQSLALKCVIFLDTKQLKNRLLMFYVLHVSDGFEIISTTSEVTLIRLPFSEKVPAVPVSNIKSSRRALKANV